MMSILQKGVMRSLGKGDGGGPFSYGSLVMESPWLLVMEKFHLINSNFDSQRKGDSDAYRSSPKVTMVERFFPLLTDRIHIGLQCLTYSHHILEMRLEVTSASLRTQHPSHMYRNKKRPSILPS